jgi:Protein of unknown function (DUF2510)
MTTPTPGWLPDPTGRHEYRYWAGDQWSDDVADGGTIGYDPVIGPEAQPGGYDDPAGGAGIDPYDSGPRSSGPSTGLLVGLGVLLAVLVVGIAWVFVSQGDDDSAETASDIGDASDETTGETAGTTTTTIATGDVGDGGAPDDAVVSSVASSLVAASNGVLTQDEASCLASGMIEQIGMDRIIEAGTAVVESGGTDLSGIYTEAERQAIAGVIGDCVPADKHDELRAVFGDIIEDVAGG